MTELDDISLPEIKDVIDLYGKSMTFTIETKTYNPATGGVSTSSASYTTIASPPFKYKIQYVNHDNIRLDDLRVIIPAYRSTFTPVEGMKVTIDGRQLVALRVDPIYSGDLICVWDVQFRK